MIDDPFSAPPDAGDLTDGDGPTIALDPSRTDGEGDEVLDAEDCADDLIELRRRLAPELPSDALHSSHDNRSDRAPTGAYRKEPQ